MVVAVSSEWTGRNVRYWHKADISVGPINVRFWTKADVSSKKTKRTSAGYGICN